MNNHIRMNLKGICPSNASITISGLSSSGPSSVTDKKPSSVVKSEKPATRSKHSKHHLEQKKPTDLIKSEKSVEQKKTPSKPQQPPPKLISPKQ